MKNETGRRRGDATALTRGGAATTVPVVFGRSDEVHGLVRLPEGFVRREGVVISPPLGFANDGTFRPLYTLANRLAHAGWPVLRFDWPGYGASGELDSMRDPLQSWQDVVEEAISSLRTAADVDSVALVGLGLGGTIATLGVAENEAVFGLALLAPPKSGRASVRELEAFRALEPPEARQDEDAAGGIAAGGYLFSRAEVDAITRIDDAVAQLAETPCGHVLVATEREVRPSLLEARVLELGANVERVVEPMLAHVLADPSVSVMPASCSELISGWLSSCGSQSSASPTPSGPVGVRPQVGPDWQERTELIATSAGTVVATRCEPSTASGVAATRWVVFLNAGKIRRSGPNRLWTVFARAWAARGVCSLRIDLPGIGDSAGAIEDDETPAPYSEDWYFGPQFVEAIRDVVDWLADEHGAREFFLTGLCSGAMWGYEAALYDDRIAGLGLLNPRLLPTSTAPLVRKLWLAGAPPPRLADTRLIRHPCRWLRRAKARALRMDALRALSGLIGRGVVVSFIFSEGDRGLVCLENQLGAEWTRVLNPPEARLTVIDGADHLFRPQHAQLCLRRALEAGLRQVGFLPGARKVRVRAGTPTSPPG